MAKYIGVTWSRPKRKWAAQVRHQMRLYNLGHYDDEETAARVRDVAARLLQGADAEFNFDGNPPEGVTEIDILERISKTERRWRS